MSVVSDGWTVVKAKVAYYIFNDKSRTSEIITEICEDAISFLITQLDTIKPNLSQTAIKTDRTLNLALTYFTCMLIVRSGGGIQKTGNISSESLEGMSVSYGAEKPNPISAPIPRDWGEMALDLINRYAIKHKLFARHLQIKTANYRTKVFEGIYNKYTKRY